MTHSSKQFLVATDFSAGSDEALDHAIDMAKQVAASLELVHVIELDGPAAPVDPAYYADRGALVAYVDLELAKRADRVRAAGLSCQTQIRDGTTAAKGIVDRAADITADLVVVGTHGRKGLAHMFLGSVAEAVVRHSHRPVLTVPFSKKAP